MPPPSEALEQATPATPRPEELPAGVKPGVSYPQRLAGLVYEPEPAA
ncbi:MULTISPECIES: hypothetical protein [unclassified Streptomyces]